LFQDSFVIASISKRYSAGPRRNRYSTGSATMPHTTTAAQNPVLRSVMLRSLPFGFATREDQLPVFRRLRGLALGGLSSAYHDCRPETPTSHHFRYAFQASCAGSGNA